MYEKKTESGSGNTFKTVISYLGASAGSILLFYLLQKSGSFTNGIREAIQIVSSGALCLILYTFSKKHLPAVVMLGIFMYVSFFFRGGEAVILRLAFQSAFLPKWILGILLIWFSGIGVLIFIRLHSPIDEGTDIRKKEFAKAFHLSSLLFILIYTLLLYYLFFLQREMDLSGNRRLNLVPLQGAFSVYWPQIIEGHFGNDAFLQFFGNLFILAPLGFILGVYGRRFPLWIRLLIPVLLAGIIESTQFFFNMGASDIDDFWMNVTGAWFGECFVFFVKARRTKITGGKEKDIFFSE